MKTRRLRVVLCLVTLLIVFGGWLAYKQDQRDRLRGPLIEAVLHQDNAEASRLLALGPTPTPATSTCSILRSGKVFIGDGICTGIHRCRGGSRSGPQC